MPNHPNQLQDRIGTGNTALIHAFGRAYGALLLLADNALEVLQVDIGNDGEAAIEIQRPDHKQIHLFDHTRRTRVDVTTDDNAEWIVYADIGHYALNPLANKQVTVWWHESTGMHQPTRSAT